MAVNSLVKRLCEGLVIPATRTMEDFQFALEKAHSSNIIVLFGDIFTLPEILKQAEAAKKLAIVHLDLINGIAKDKAGIKYLALMGVKAVITTKPHLGKIAHQEGMTVIQRLFLMDNEALRTGIHMMSTFKPDAIEVLPGLVPKNAIDKLSQATGLPILSGGLLCTEEDVNRALDSGICSVSTSDRDLWKLPPRNGARKLK
ncbi:MAG: glycerol-3-phosphate responsive antiterminator, GlpP [Firmicutes bacterium]|nr:glycerol-3-phosphate responsive antiterminator, GlpP [Bacillota bacterium]